MRFFTFKLLIISLVVGALMLAGAGVASATTQTSEAGGIRVTASLPDTATAGSQIDALFAVENLTTQWKFTRICVSFSKDGAEPYRVCRSALLPPLRKLQLSYSFTLPAAEPGEHTYTVGISAGEASASATITVYG